MSRLLVCLLLTGCGWWTCPGGTIGSVHRPWNPPLDEDGQICRLTDRSITADHHNIAMAEVQQRYLLHYGNHDWRVSKEAGSMQLTQGDLVVDVTFETRGAHVRTVLQRR